MCCFSAVTVSASRQGNHSESRMPYKGWQHPEDAQACQCTPIINSSNVARNIGRYALFSDCWTLPPGLVSAGAGEGVSFGAGASPGAALCRTTRLRLPLSDGDPKTGSSRPLLHSPLVLGASGTGHGAAKRACGVAARPMTPVNRLPGWRCNSACGARWPASAAPCMALCGELRLPPAPPCAAVLL